MRVGGAFGAAILLGLACGFGQSACAVVAGLGDDYAGGGGDDARAPDDSSTGGNDGPVVRDAAPVDACAGHAICDFFDDDTPLESRWTVMGQKVATLSKSLQHAHSAPGALRLEVPADDNANAAPSDVIAFQDTPTDAPHVKCSFALRVDQAGSDWLSVVYIEYGGDSLVFAAFADNTTDVHLFSNNNVPNGPDLQPGPDGFDVVTIEIDVVAGLVDVRTNGGHTNWKGLPLAIKPQPMRLVLGANYLKRPNSAAWDLSYDDVVCDVLP